MAIVLKNKLYFINFFFYIQVTKIVIFLFLKPVLIIGIAVILNVAARCWVFQVGNESR